MIDHAAFEDKRDRFLNNFKPKRGPELTNQEVAIMLKQYAKTEVADEKVQEWIGRCWIALTQKQRRVVELRFGLKSGSRSMTNREVADRMGITMRRVQQHWRKAKEVLGSVKPEGRRVQA